MVKKSIYIISRHRAILYSDYSCCSGGDNCRRRRLRHMETKKKSKVKVSYYRYFQIMTEYCKDLFF